ncbi:MAG: ADP-ribosylglycohydrolase family protein [Akkermansiaceae bacterium]
MNTVKDRYRGALLGLATGDALGTTVEFSQRGTFKPMTDIIGGGPFDLKAGQWTDDTSMALCLAESLVANNGMNLPDHLERYLSWWKTGHNSVTGRCFDIGNTVKQALECYRINHQPYAGSQDPSSAGNGSIMRLAPVPLFYATEKDIAIHQSAESSKTTHGSAECIDACRTMACILVNFLHGQSKQEALSSSALINSIEPNTQKIKAILQGSYQTKQSEEIRGSGYVVDSLEAALWAFWNSDNFEQGALLAVNLGDDADTTGAVYGQIAGSYYGKKGIPKHWLKKIAWHSKIQRLADKLYKSSRLDES